MMDLHEFLKVPASPGRNRELALEHDLGQRRNFMRQGIVDNILAASLYTRSGKWKHGIVVDEDINIEDLNEVLRALTTRFQPATDMYMIPRGITSTLEPLATWKA